MNAWWSRLVVVAVAVLLLGISGLADPASTRAAWPRCSTGSRPSRFRSRRSR